MKQISAEDCYAIWHKYVNEFHNRYVRTVKNFSHARDKEYWVYFERFANMCNRSGGNIDYKMFINIMVNHYNGWFQPKLLGAPKSIKLYKSYIKQQQEVTDPVQIKRMMLRDILFISSFANEHNLETLQDYLDYDKWLIPVVYRHLNGGSISPYTFYILPNIYNIIESYPSDATNDFIPNYTQQYNLHRVRLYNIDDEDVKKLIKNIEILFKKIKTKLL